MYNTKLIQKRLSQLKKEKIFNNQGLADFSGVHYNTICKLVSGSNVNPTIRTLISLANAFNKTISWFIE